MEWWEEFGTALQFMPDAPALALDMTTGGPKHQPFRYSLAYNMQNSPDGLEVYPSEGAPLPGGE